MGKLSGVLFFLTAELFLAQAVSGEAGVDYCQTFNHGRNVHTHCRGDRTKGLTFPGEFSESVIPSNTTNLHLYSYVTPGAVAYADYTGLALGENYVTIQLTGFNEAVADPRFPLNEFFTHNKHIRGLELFNVKLLLLVEGDLRGFSRLQTLVIEKCQIEAVDVAAFEGLGLSPAGEVIANFKPSLQRFKLYGNSLLTNLDWSFLIPVSTSLKEIRVEISNLYADTLTCSVPFTLQQAKTISFNANDKLRQIPSAIFKTFNPNLLLQIYLEGLYMRFCSDSADCGCCDMYEFVKWLRDNNQVFAVKDISCGNGTRKNDADSLATLNYDHCTGSQ